MAYAFSCDHCRQVLEDGEERMIVVAARYAVDGEPLLAQELPAGGPDMAGLVPVHADRLIFHLACWDEWRGA